MPCRELRGASTSTSCMAPALPSWRNCSAVWVANACMARAMTPVQPVCWLAPGPAVLSTCPVLAPAAAGIEGDGLDFVRMAVVEPVGRVEIVIEDSVQGRRRDEVVVDVE